LEVTQTVRVFYDPNAANHPVLQGEQDIYANTPNWFYYWRKGGVVSDLETYDFRFATSTPQGHEVRYGRFEPPSGLYVGPLAGSPQTVNHTFQNKYYNTKLTTGENGINDSLIFPAQNYWNVPRQPDDAILIPKDYGEPHAVAIVPGDDGILYTQPWPDDQRIQIDGVWVITTGADGILNISDWAKDPRDRYMKYVYDGREVEMGLGRGRPGTIAIAPGIDGWLDLYWYPGGDDQVMEDANNLQDLRLNHSYVASWDALEVCAITCVHELEHKRHHDDRTAAQQAHPGMIVDLDDDTVITINEGEDHYFLNCYIRDTYDVASELGNPDYSYYGDSEFLCRMSEMNYSDPNGLVTEGKIGPQQDWSKGGRQWRKY